MCSWGRTATGRWPTPRTSSGVAPVAARVPGERPGRSSRPPAKRTRTDSLAFTRRRCPGRALVHLQVLLPEVESTLADRVPHLAGRPQPIRESAGLQIGPERVRWRWGDDPERLPTRTPGFLQRLLERPRVRSQLLRFLALQVVRQDHRLVR